MTKQLQHITIIITLLFVNSIYAQDFEETNYYYLKSNPSQTYAIDTGLNNMQHYNFMSTDNFDNFNLGNTGQAHQTTTLDWNNQKGFKSGMTHFDLYKYNINKIKYYDIKKPLSEISYFMGSKRESIFGAKFAHNVKNRLNYGMNFHRIASTGVYQKMRTRNGNFSLYGIYSSKNSRYNLSVDMTFTNLKTEENGGFEADFVNNPSLLQPNKEFYVPKIDEGVTTHKNLNVLITNTYHLGLTRIDSVNDSTNVKRFHPTFSLNYSTGTQRNTYQFVDNDADTTYYGNFFQANDSTFYRLYYHQIPNRVSISYSGLMNKQDTIQYRNFSGEVGAQHDNIELWQNRKEMTTNNVHVFGNIKSNAWSNKKWQYLAEGYYFMTGYNQNDWKVKGVFAYNFGKFGQAEIAASLEQQEASWIENSYYSTTLTWKNNFNKKTRTNFSFYYYLPSQKLKFHAEYNVLGNYIYFNEEGLPQQLNTATHYWQAYASKELQYKILHFDNFVGIQGNNNQETLRLPKVFLKSSLYIEGKIFKGNMLARLGADLRYNSNFMANAWQPLTGQFYIQNEQTMHYTPVLDIFLSFKVKTLRVFAKANYVNEGLGKKNYYTALGYPDRGRTFAGGLIWRFFE